MRYLSLLSVLTIIIFGSCSKDNDDVVNEKGKRTVLMYMCAENDLDKGGFFNSDWEEIKKGANDLGANDYLLAYVDRYSNDIKPCIYRISKDGIVVVKQYDENFYSTDPEKMAEVMKWVVSHYPSDSYGLTFWGHGSGWLVSTLTTTSSSAKVRKAYGYDAGNHLANPSKKWINIKELTNTIKTTMPRLDYIFFDCCNMQCAEVAYEMRNITDYIIGSPSEIPARGAPYDYVLKDFFLAKEAVGKAIVDDYLQHGNFSGATGLPLSVFKTSGMDNLALATQYALTKFVPQYPAEANTDKCIYYFVINNTNGLDCIYDIRNFMRNNLAEADFATWDKALSDVVVYRRFPKYDGWNNPWSTIFNIKFSTFSLTEDNYGGMSIFVPKNIYTTKGTSGYVDPNVAIFRTEWSNIVDWSQYGWQR